jgi:hypothetical protein
MKKGFATILIMTLVLVAGIVLISYMSLNNKKSLKQISQNSDLSLNSPTPITNSANLGNNRIEWKTYRSQEYGFMIDYPSNWIYATNTENKEQDKYETLQLNHVVVITEGDIDTISTYQLGRIIITNEGPVNETDIEKMFDDNMKKLEDSPIIPGNLRSKDKVVITRGNIKVLKLNPFFVDQESLFILNKKLFQIRVNFAGDDEGLGSAKNNLLMEIYNHVIDSLRPL